MGNPADAADREQQVDEAIAAYLEAAEAGQPPDRSQFIAKHRAIADELRAFFADQDQFARLAEPLALGSHVKSSAARRSTRVEDAAPADTIPAHQPAHHAVPDIKDFGDYEVIEEIARGGMGVVFKARQRSLNRLVAVKMILSGKLASATDVQRFRSEAEAAARLDHPGIVPIYEVGVHEGHHFFSMKLVEGGSLGAKHRRWQGDQYACARLVARVARAVHYAHQRSLLHRDLKPANILLDPAGNPYVTDFGLAKLLDSDPGLTPSGGVVGTPKYMAPEQAIGKGPPTTAVDVYGIGGILYELITNRPPFQADTPMETMIQVVEKEPDRPASLNPHIKPDLETICLKCLEKDPARRYGSAEAVAEELERFVAGEPILARHTGPAARLWRWCCRKPALAGLTAALLVVFIGSFIAVTALWQQALANFREKEAQRLEASRQRDEADRNRAEAEKNQKEAERQRDRAEEGFRRAHRLVDQFCIQVSEKELAQVPGLQPLRLRLLQAALDYSREFVKERPDDPVLQGELGATLARSAGVIAIIGSKAKSAEMLQEAAAIFRKIQAEQGDKVNLTNLKADLGRVYNRLGILQCDLNQSPEKSYQQARALFEELSQQFPDKIEYQTDLAAVLTNLGVLYHDLNRYDDSMAAYNEDLAINERLARQYPRDHQRRHSLAIVSRNIAAVHRDKGQRREADACLQRSFDLLTRLVAEQPTVRDYQFTLAETLRTMGTYRREADDIPGAEEAFKDSADRLSKLVADNPSVLPYLSALAATYRELGRMHLDTTNELAKALDEFQKARDLGDRMVAADPNGVDYQTDLAKSWTQMAAVLARNKQNADAARCYEKVGEIRQKQMKAYPQAVVYRQELTRALINQGQARWRDGQRVEGAAIVRQAIDNQREAVRQAPADQSQRSTLGFAYKALAELEAKAGRLAEGVNAYKEFRKLWPEHAGHQYEAARELALITSWIGKGNKDLTPAETAQREEYALLALESLRTAIRCGFRDAARLEKDGYFAVLREREDFKRLAEEIAGKP